jgi:hypothetical protein
MHRDKLSVITVRFGAASSVIGGQALPKPVVWLVAVSNEQLLYLPHLFQENKFEELSRSFKDMFRLQ